MNGGDAIDRAVRRNGVRSGSELEHTIRANMYYIAGTGGDKVDEKLDEYIAKSKAAFPDSVETDPRVRPPLDPLNLTREQFNDIAAGKVAVG